MTHQLLRNMGILAILGGSLDYIQGISAYLNPLNSWVCSYMKFKAGGTIAWELKSDLNELSQAGSLNLSLP